MYFFSLPVFGISFWFTFYRLIETVMIITMWFIKTFTVSTAFVLATIDPSSNTRTLYSCFRPRYRTVGKSIFNRRITFALELTVNWWCDISINSLHWHSNFLIVFFLFQWVNGAELRKFKYLTEESNVKGKVPVYGLK